MTLASALYGSQGAPYVSNRAYPATANYGANGNTHAADTLYLVPFVVRRAVTIDAVWWWRSLSTAANFYVGILEADGTVVTDCAVDSNTVAGLHSVATTPVRLVPTELYYHAVNASEIGRAHV